jgi:opacity protein-like surface antigen
MKILLSASLFALILSGSQASGKVVESAGSEKTVDKIYSIVNYSLKKDPEEKAQNQTSRKVAGSAGPEKAKIVAKKSVVEISPFEDKPNSFKKDSEKKAQNQTSQIVAESTAPKKTEIVAEKSVEKKEESNRGNGTRGNYVGISLNKNQLNFHEELTATDTPYGIKYKPSASRYGIGAGLTYKYAINFHDFFIAPGAFFEKNWTSSDGNSKIFPDFGYNQVVRLDIDSRYGFTADVGYDFTNKFAAYLMGGYSFINYTAKNGGGTDISNHQTVLKKSSNGSAIVGLGAKYNYSDRVSFNVEANTQKFNLKNNTDVPYNSGYDIASRYAGRFNTLKVGISYNF